MLSRRETAGAEPDTVQVVRPVLNGGREETCGNATRLAPTQLPRCGFRQRLKPSVRCQRHTGTSKTKGIQDTRHSRHKAWCRSPLVSRTGARRPGREAAEHPTNKNSCGAQPPPNAGLNKPLGTHQGLLGYTIGQREGIGIATGAPLYVVAIDQPRNRLVVGSREDVMNRTLTAERLNWVSIDPPTESSRALVKIRARHEPAWASLLPQPDERLRVVFDEPQQAITPGQAVVFYDAQADGVLGGGWIAATS